MEGPEDSHEDTVEILMVAGNGVGRIEMQKTEGKARGTVSSICSLNGLEDRKREELVGTRTRGVCAEQGGLFPAVGNGACLGHVLRNERLHF